MKGLATYPCGERSPSNSRVGGHRPSLPGSLMTRPTSSALVSGFLLERVQQIHSLRESGVISSHAAQAFESEDSAFRRSAGSSCAVPPEIFLAML